MKKYIRKRDCQRHNPQNRDISHYYLDDRYRYKTVDYYSCIQCAEMDLEEDAKEEDRRNRIFLNEQKQQQEASERRKEKYFSRLEKKKKSQQEDLWDFVVEAELLRGVKNKHLYAGKIPKELLQLQRVQMKIQRLIKTKKGKIAKEKEDRELKALQEAKALREQQEYIAEKLAREFKDCKKHPGSSLIKAGKCREDYQLYKCKECVTETRKWHYIQNKAAILHKQELYRQANLEKVRETRRKSWKKMNDKLRKEDRLNGFIIYENY